MTHADTTRVEDLKHLHEMIDHLSAAEVHRAMDLLEDIFYSRPDVRARIEAAGQGPGVPMDEVLAEYDLTDQNLHAGLQSGKAA